MLLLSIKQLLRSASEIGGRSSSNSRNHQIISSSALIYDNTYLLDIKPSRQLLLQGKSALLGFILADHSSILTTGRIKIFISAHNV